MMVTDAVIPAVVDGEGSDIVDEIVCGSYEVDVKKVDVAVEVFVSITAGVDIVVVFGFIKPLLAVLEADLVIVVNVVELIRGQFSLNKKAQRLEQQVQSVILSVCEQDATPASRIF